MGTYNAAADSNSYEAMDSTAQVRAILEQRKGADYTPSPGNGDQVVEAIQQHIPDYQPVDYAAEREQGQAYDSSAQNEAIWQNVDSATHGARDQATNFIGSVGESDMTGSESNTREVAGTNGRTYDLTQVGTTVAASDQAVTDWASSVGPGTYSAVYRPNQNSRSPATAAGTASGLPMPAPRGGGGGGFGAAVEAGLARAGGFALKAFGVLGLLLSLGGDSPQRYLSNDTKQIGGVSIRTDVTLPEGGRSGQRVKNLTGPPNSAARGAGGNRVYITDSEGRVVKDITRNRVKPVTPGVGFGDKEFDLTEEEKDILTEFGY